MIRFAHRELLGYELTLFQLLQRTTLDSLINHASSGSEGTAINQLPAKITLNAQELYKRRHGYVNDSRFSISVVRTSNNDKLFFKA